MYRTRGQKKIASVNDVPLFRLPTPALLRIVSESPEVLVTCRFGISAMKEVLSPMDIVEIGIRKHGVMGAYWKFKHSKHLYSALMAYMRDVRWETLRGLGAPINLHWACIYGNLAIVQGMVRKLKSACSVGCNNEILGWMTETNYKRRCLSEAVSKGHVRVCKYLVSEGALENVDEIDVLQQAVESGDVETCEYVRGIVGDEIDGRELLGLMEIALKKPQGRRLCDVLAQGLDARDLMVRATECRNVSTATYKYLISRGAISDRDVLLRIQKVAEKHKKLLKLLSHA